MRKKFSPLFQSIFIHLIFSLTVSCFLNIQSFAFEKGSDADKIDRILFYSSQKQKELKLILKRKPKLSQREKDELLIKACNRNSLLLVKYLLKNGANIYTQKTWSKTGVLHVAIKENTEILAYLLKNHADAHARDRWDKTAIMQAAQYFCYPSFKYLYTHIKDKKALQDELDEINYTDFILAAIFGELSKLQILCEKENISAEEINIAYLWACEKNDIKMQNFLLKKGADVNKENTMGMTPIMNAIKYKNIKMVKILLKKGAKLNILARGYSSPLILACATNDIFLIKLLLRNGAKVNFNHQGGNNPLIYACGRCSIKIVKLLLKHKANVNSEIEAGFTPLMAACKRGNIAIVKLLLERNAHINAGDDAGVTPLSCAVASKNIKLVKLLIKEGADIDQDNLNASSLVSTAIHRRDFKMAKFLINKGANVNDNRWNTPLMEAIKSNNVAIVKLLLSKGADPLLKSKYKAEKSILKTAEDLGNRSIIRLLKKGIKNREKILKKAEETEIQRKKRNKKLLYLFETKNLKQLKKNMDQNKNYLNNEQIDYILRKACANGSLRILKFLYKRGIRFDKRYTSQNIISPLMLAVEKGHLKTIKFLIKKGAKFDSKENSIQEAVMAACLYRHLNILKYLVKKGFNTNYTNNEGETVFDLAHKYKYFEIFSYLLSIKNLNTRLYLAIKYEKKALALELIKKGANLKLEPGKDFYIDTTILIEALKKEYVDITLTLLKNCKKEDRKYLNNTIWNKKNNNDSALQIAVENGYYKVAELLLKKGAKVNYANAEKRTALHTACTKGDLKMIKLLIKYNADPKLKNNYNQNAFNILKEQGNNALIPYLKKQD